MVLRMSTQPRIDNPREYSTQTVEDLHVVLRLGGQARRDSQRENFYELEGPNASFYIYVSPITGNIVLLARWLRQSQEACIDEVNMVA